MSTGCESCIGDLKRLKAKLVAIESPLPPQIGRQIETVGEIIDRREHGDEIMPDEYSAYARAFCENFILLSSEDVGYDSGLTLCENCYHGNSRPCELGYVQTRFRI